MNILKTVFVILGLFGMAYSLTVNFAPIEVGNVWVYEKSYKNAVWYTIPEYTITKTIQITTTESRNDTTYFSASVRDSGIVDPRSSTPDKIDCQYYVQGFMTKDTVRTNKVNDSIVVSEKGIENFDIGNLFPFPVRDTAGRDSVFMSEKFYSWGDLIVDSYGYSRTGGGGADIDSFLLLQNTGLLARTIISIRLTGGDAHGGTTTIRLISFNGKPAPDINLSSANHFPPNKRKTSNQTAFRQLAWIHRGCQAVPQNVRVVFDVRGRAVSASGLTNRHLNSGIYLYRD